MSAKIFYQEDCNLSLLEGKTIAIVGYGSQGHAHALNLKESGCHVIIGLYEGASPAGRRHSDPVPAALLPAGDGDGGPDGRPGGLSCPAV